MESPLTKKASPFNTKGPMLLQVVLFIQILPHCIHSLFMSAYFKIVEHYTSLGLCFSAQLCFKKNLHPLSPSGLSSLYFQIHWEVTSVSATRIQ